LTASVESEIVPTPQESEKLSELRQSCHDTMPWLISFSLDVGKSAVDQT